MSFFYDLNKKLAALAAKTEQQQIAESKKEEAVAKSPLTQALNESAVAEAGYSAKAGRAGKDLGKPGKNFAKIAKGAAERYGSKAAGERVAGAVLNKLRHPKEDITDEGNAFTGALKATPKGGKFKVGNKEFTDTSSLEEVGMTPKQKKFAKLAPPANKITFADKIAGAKKEVDEMLGDVAAEAIKGAIGKKKEPRSKGTAFDRDFMKQQQVKKDAESHSRYDVQDTGYSKRYTRKAEEPKDDAEVSTEPKKRGRPAGAPKGPERTTKGAWKHKGDRKVKAEEDLDSDGVMMTRPTNCSSEGAADKSALKSAIALLKKNGYNVSKKETMDEESTDKEDQRAERAGKKVAKDIEYDEGHKAKDDNKAEKAGKKVTKDIEYDDKKDKVKETAAEPKSSKGTYNFGGGVYESLDNRVESIINEGMSINISVDEQGKKSISVNATDADAEALAQLLKMAGLEGGAQEACPTCGSAECGCDAEMVDENSPDWPTNTETSDNALQYSGGLNGPKSTGQTTIPVVASQLRRQVSMEENVKVERSLLDLYKTFKNK